MMTDYELIHGTLDCADASVEFCPICGIQVIEDKYDDFKDTDGNLCCCPNCLNEYYQ